MIKRMFLVPLFGLGFLVGCGGSGGGPGVEDFSTVYLTSSIQQSSINVDLIDYSLDNTTNPPSCKTTIPMSDNENQKLTITVTQKPNLPAGVQPSEVVISDLRVSFTPAVGQLDPCFNVAQPSGVYTVNANSSFSFPFPVITQDIKNCMVNKYLISTNGCTTASFNFPQDPNNPNFYTVYATLTYKATEVYTGKSKTITINFGTYRLSDFTSQTQ